MLQITTDGNSLNVKGIGNGTYPLDGFNSYPLNSIIVQTDGGTDMVTFRSAATNDVLFSGVIGEIEINGETVAKGDIISKFDGVSNAPTGGGGGGGTVNAYTKQESDARYATKAEAEAAYAVASDADGKADAVTSRIEDVETAMDDKQDVLVSGANIKTVNGNTLLGSGNVQIDVPDAYDKQETDGLLAGKANVGASYTKEESDAKYLTEHQPLDGYATKAELATKADAGVSYTKEEENGLLAGKADAGVSYTKAEANGLLAGKADAGVSYTKEESDGKYLTEHQSLANYATKAELAAKADAGVSYTKQESDAKYLTEHQDISGLATKAEVEAKQDALSAGNGISIEGNTISCTLDGKLFIVTQTLPTEGIDEGKIYVVPDAGGEEGNMAVEYIRVNGKWEEIGRFKAETDLSAYYTKAETDGLLSGKADAGVSYTKDESDGKYASKDELAGKANVGASYTKDESDAKYLTEHQSLASYATKAEVSAKQDALVSGTNIKTLNGNTLLGAGNVQIDVPDAYTKQETDALLVGKANVGVSYTKEESDAKYLTSHQDISGLATKAEVNAKQDALVSGTNIKTVGGSSLLGSGDIPFPDAYTKDESDGKYATQAEMDDAAADISALEADMAWKQATLVPGTNIKTLNGVSLLGSGDLTTEWYGSQEEYDAIAAKDPNVTYYITEAQA